MSATDIHLWWLWGLGWLFMPRMIVGLFITLFTPYHTLGIVLAIIGGVCDLGSSGSNIEVTRRKE